MQVPSGQIPARRAWDARGLGAGRGPSQLDLVNCTLPQFEFGASDGAGPWGEEGLVVV